ncbi:hypothetical protein [Coralloluteibacterium thermophilus]|uniref:Uncharacterized protein n=1 Tax=Coralloluteibacterium thermophilum TaxID=2707049 RepID=A0ABV9NIR6_9GAMM
MTLTTVAWRTGHAHTGYTLHDDIQPGAEALVLRADAEREIERLQADIETMRECLREAVGDDGSDWQDADGWPIGRFLTPAVAGDYTAARAELEAHRAEVAAVAAEMQEDDEEATGHG